MGAISDVRRTQTEPGSAGGCEANDRRLGFNFRGNTTPHKNTSDTQRQLEEFLLAGSGIKVCC
jgi:hypothetical protein